MASANDEVGADAPPAEVYTPEKIAGGRQLGIAAVRIAAKDVKRSGTCARECTLVGRLQVVKTRSA